MLKYAYALDPNDPCLIQGVAQITCLEPLFQRIVSLVATFAGVIFFIMLVVGGFRYLLSAGDAKKTEAAKGTLTAAFLGLVLIVAAYLLIYIVARFTGLKDLTTFRILQF